MRTMTSASIRNLTDSESATNIILSGLINKPINSSTLRILTVEKSIIINSEFYTCMISRMSMMVSNTFHKFYRNLTNPYPTNLRIFSVIKNINTTNDNITLTLFSLA